MTCEYDKCKKVVPVLLCLISFASSHVFKIRCLHLLCPRRSVYSENQLWRRVDERHLVSLPIGFPYTSVSSSFWSISNPGCLQLTMRKYFQHMRELRGLAISMRPMASCATSQANSTQSCLPSPSCSLCSTDSMGSMGRSAGYTF